MRIGANIGHVYALPNMDEWMGVLDGFSSVRWLNALRTNINWWEVEEDSFVPRKFSDLPPHGDLEPVDVWKTGKGIAPSKCLELSNELDADCWLTVPHRFTAGEMWRYAHSLLPYVGNRVIRAELGGEIFNSNFLHRHEYERDSVGNLDPNGYKAALIAHATRTIEMANAFKNSGAKIKVVLSGHSTNTWMMEYMLGETDVGKYIDSIAIAPYVGVQSKTIQDMYNELWDAGERVVKYRRIADRHGLDLDIYEGGQHVIHNKSSVWNRSDWMGRWYLYYLMVMRASGVDLFHIYSIGGLYKPDQAWGLYEIVSGKFVPTPKIDSVREFMES